MRAIAVMLAEEPPKEEKAKIRAEALIRDDNLIEAYEILQLECEMLHERIKLIESTKGCPKDLMSVVATIMWASQRVDIPELVMVRKQFRARYGKGFEEAALENVGNILNERVVTKLSFEPPAAYLVQTYLERICERFEVDWAPTIRLSAEQMIEPMAPPVGYSVAVAQGTGLGVINMEEATTGQPNTDQEINYAKQNGGIPPALPVATATATVYVPPNIQQQQAGTKTSAPSGSIPSANFEEVDIFVPGGGTPAAPVAGSGSLPATKGKSEGKNDNNEDEQSGSDAGDVSDDEPSSGATGASATAGGEGSSSTTYADLAARFDSLNK